MDCTVFIEAEAGSRVKGVYDERSFARLRERRTLAPYPYAYGFIPGTQGGPEDECLDCYVITRRSLTAGRPYELSVFGLLEFYEGAEPDHKLLAAPVDEPAPSIEAQSALREELADFITAIFKAYPDISIRVGELRPAVDAERLLAERLARRPALRARRHPG